MRVDELPFGFSWVIDEPMVRASHALADGGRVWLVDPVDAPEALARVRALGTAAAVLQLLDRHNRDCAAVAARLGVPHLRVPDAVPDSPFEIVAPVRAPGWRESALWWPAKRALVVAEAIGTGAWFTLGTGPAGVHPMLRALPPKALRPFEPEHLLVGHGRGVHGAAATAALRHAYAHARRDVPRLLTRLPSLLRR